jgi:hypothetical protein
MHTVGSAEEARQAVAWGVDVVVAQGWEAGGHTGHRLSLHVNPFRVRVVDQRQAELAGHTGWPCPPRTGDGLEDLVGDAEHDPERRGVASGRCGQCPPGGQQRAAPPGDQEADQDQVRPAGRVAGRDHRGGKYGHCRADACLSHGDDQRGHERQVSGDDRRAGYAA